MRTRLKSLKANVSIHWLLVMSPSILDLLSSLNILSSLNCLRISLYAFFLVTAALVNCCFCWVVFILDPACHLRRYIYLLSSFSCLLDNHTICLLFCKYTSYVCSAKEFLNALDLNWLVESSSLPVSLASIISEHSFKFIRVQASRHS